MSGANERSGVEIEYEDATKTALAYLQAVGVVGPYEDSTPEYRERETATMRAAILGATQLPNDPSAARSPILGATQLPNDPSAARAAYLGHCYLHRGSDSRDLESLLKKDRKHPAYRKALTILLPEMRRAGVAIPERLQRWEHEHERVTGRWSQQATQKYRIGLVVEAMATGSNVLVLCGEKERTLRQLQVDLRAVHEQLGGKSFEELCSGHASERLQDIERCHEIRNDYVLKIPNGIERTLEILNGMNARPWGHRDQGKGLTASDLVEMTNLPLSEGMGVHGIWTAIKVRKHFPNLYATRNEDTEAQGFYYSICDAVADVLEEEKARRAGNYSGSKSARIGSSYRSVLRALAAYRRTFWPVERRAKLTPVEG